MGVFHINPELCHLIKPGVFAGGGPPPMFLRPKSIESILSVVYSSLRSVCKDSYVSTAGITVVFQDAIGLIAFYMPL